MINISNNIYSDNNRCKAGTGIACSRPSFTGLNKLPLRECADSFISSKTKELSPKNIFKRIASELLPVDFEKGSKTPKLSDNLREMIVSVTKKASDATGKDAIVFSIPEHDNLVLRVEKSAMGKIDSLGKDLELVPISYDKSVSENKNLGLPLYFVAEKGSEIAGKKSISPLEALSQPDKIMVLKKVEGQHPSQQYWEDLTTLMGYDDFHPDKDQLNNFYYLGYVRANFGNDAAIKFLENCKQGVTELKPHDLAEGSDTFTIVGGQKFYQSYRKFADDYIKSLKDISEMPQESYNKAVDTILAPKDFIMDFQHTNNTFVDLKNNEFNFMDFVFDKSLYPKYHYDNPIKEFRNVLMGKCFSIEFKTPRQLMIYPEDIAQVKVHSNAINEKVNNASPERFRSRSPFS